MFEGAELGAQVSRDEYRERALALRQSLLQAQRELRAADTFPVIIVLAGFDASGRSETANLLNEWMDPRWVVTCAWGEPSDEELERPAFWRYWRRFPPQGQIGLFHGAWYEPVMTERVERRIGRHAFESRLRQITSTEQALTDDGALILKFWLHLSADAQRRQLKAFERDPLTRWRVTIAHWRRQGQYRRIKQAAEVVIRQTSTARAPWHIVEGTDDYYRKLTVVAHVRDAIDAELGRAAAAQAAPASGAGTRQGTDAGDPPDAPVDPLAHGANVLSVLDLTQAVDRDRYRVELAKQQGRLNRLQRQAAAQGLSTIATFEGWDASGKGGAIRRVTGALDARHYRVIPIGAPTDEELAHHYLWRFMRHLSRAGRITIFDRSWYGRVLVERVEGLASRDEYMRAYSEINAFEDQLVDHGILLIKCWLHISKGEQLRRFNERRETPHKAWKLTDDDWRNRRRWEHYELAVNEMVARTSTRRAPWVLVEANDKLFARLKVIRTLADRLDRALRKRRAARKP